MSVENPLRILVVGQTPPPYHGQAIAIAELVKAKWPDISISHVRMAYSTSAAEIGKFSFGKVLQLFSCIRQSICELRKNPETILYYPPGGSTVPIIRDIIFLFFVRPFAAKLVLHFHASGMEKTLRSKWWLRETAQLAYGRANIAIKLQPSIPPDAESLNPRKVTVVPNGLDVPQVSPSRAKGSRPVRILFAGAHTEEKGIYMIIEVIKRLKQMGFEVQMHMMGSWGSKGEEIECQHRVKEYNLEQNIFFLGCLVDDKKWQEYADADLFFFPTFYRAELMPLVVIEAMAFSLPVIASKWRGIVDMISDGENGFLFPAKNVNKATKQLAKVIADASLQKSLGKAARLCYEQNYTLSKHLDAMRKVFIDLGNTQ